MISGIRCATAMNYKAVKEALNLRRYQRAVKPMMEARKYMPLDSLAMQGDLVTDLVSSIHQAKVAAGFTSKV